MPSGRLAMIAVSQPKISRDILFRPPMGDRPTARWMAARTYGLRGNGVKARATRAPGPCRSRTVAWACSTIDRLRGRHYDGRAFEARVDLTRRIGGTDVARGRS